MAKKTVKAPKNGSKKTIAYIIGTVFCAGIMLVGLLERSRTIMVIGGGGFVAFLGMALSEWAKD